MHLHGGEVGGSTTGNVQIQRTFQTLLVYALTYSQTHCRSCVMVDRKYDLTLCIALNERPLEAFVADITRIKFITVTSVIIVLECV